MEITAAAYSYSDLRGRDAGNDILLVYCLDDDGPLSIQLTDITVSVQVALPQSINWTEKLALEFGSYLTRSGRIPIREFFFSFRFASYYYSALPNVPTLTVVFSSIEARNHFCNIYNSPKTTISGFANLPPFRVRVWEGEFSLIRQFLSNCGDSDEYAKRMSYSGWMTVKNARLVTDDAKFSVDKREYIASCKDVIPRNDLSTKPTNPKVLSLDLETFSLNVRAMPNSARASDCTYIATIAVKYLNEKIEQAKKYAIVYGHCSRHIEGATVIIVKSEKELYEKYAEIVAFENPEIITGYNIYGYDFDFMRLRNEHHDIFPLIETSDDSNSVKRSFPAHGKLLNETCYISNRSWSSGAYGFNNINYPVTAGRIYIDMITPVKRNFKLGSYTLNRVSKRFLNKEKLDMGAEEMFCIYRENQKWQRHYASFERMFCYIPSLKETLKQISFDEVDTKKSLSSLITSFTNDELQAIFKAIMSSFPEFIIYECMREFGLTNLDQLVERATFDAVVSEEQLQSYLEISHTDIGRRIDRCGAQIMRRCSTMESKTAFPGQKFDVGVIVKNFFSINEHRPESIEFFLVTTLPMLFSAVQNNYITQIVQMYLSRYLIVRQMRSKSKIDLTRVVDYGIRDSELPLELFTKLNIWASAVAESNVNGVSIQELYTGGQQIRCISQYYDEAYRKKVIVDKRESPTYGFGGGYVAKPIKGFHQNIIVFDFASMYPSIIMRYNLCYTTLVDDITNGIDYSVPDEMCHVIEITQEETMADPDATEETKGKKEIPVTKHYRLRFVKREFRQGIIPQIAERMVNERRRVRAIGEAAQKRADALDLLVKKVRILSSFSPEKIPEIISMRTKLEEIKQNSGNWYEFLGSLLAENYVVDAEFLNEHLPRIGEYEAEIAAKRTEAMLCDKLQFALKVSCNSYFGFFGVRNGAIMSLMEAAICTTFIGRTLIKQAADFVIAKYGGRIIYGDTDSFMIDLGIKDKKECHYWGNKLVGEINSLFEDPIKMEFEKADDGIFFKKKKYAYLCIDKFGKYKTKIVIDAEGKYTNEYIIETKGIVVQRRDNSKLLRDIYLSLLKKCLLRESFYNVIAELISCIEELLAYRYPISKFAITRSVSASYASDTYFMNTFVERLKKEGKQISGGDRLEYFILESDKTAVADKMKLLEDYNEKTDRPDVQHYLDSALKNPINQLIKVSYREEIRNYNDYYFSNNLGNRIDFNHIIDLIQCQLRANLPLSGILDYIRQVDTYLQFTVNNKLPIIYRIERTFVRDVNSNITYPHLLEPQLFPVVSSQAVPQSGLRLSYSGNSNGY